LVNNASSSFAALNYQLNISEGNSSAQDSGSAIGFEGYDGGTFNRNYAGLGGFKENATSGNYAGYLAFATRPNGGLPVERMRITSSGNVGIGTTAPGNKLNVHSGSLQITSASTGTGASAGLQLSMSADAASITNKQNDILTFGTNNLERMRISSSGDVGIGTTAPSTDFELVDESSNANMYTTAYSGFGAVVGRSANGTMASPTNSVSGDKLATFGGSGYGGGWPNSSRGSLDIYAAENWSATNNGTYITFKTTPNTTTSPAERLRIDHDGQVGIGTNNPSTTLDVSGDTKSTHFVGGGSAPTIAAGAAAGTGPTISVTGTDSAHIVAVTAGTTPTSNTTIATVTFNTAFSSAPVCVYSAANANAAVLFGSSGVYINSTTSSYTLMLSPGALTASTQYIWNVHCIQ
jgi:hypothetical protein